MINVYKACDRVIFDSDYEKIDYTGKRYRGFIYSTEYILKKIKPDTFVGGLVLRDNNIQSIAENCFKGISIKSLHASYACFIIMRIIA